MIKKRNKKLILKNSLDFNIEAIQSDIYNGDGITKSNIEKIFEPFYSNKPTGSGFGMYISRQIIKDHGGNISISSEGGFGTIVKMGIPYE